MGMNLVCTPTCRVVPGQWHHLQLGVDGPANRLRVWFDDPAPIIDLAGVTAVPAATIQVGLAARAVDSANPLIWHIDDVAISSAPRPFGALGDAGTPDAGDAGSQDAGDVGRVDGGSEEMPDASVGEDGGPSGPTAVRVGCGCHASHVEAFVVGILSLLRTRRRRPSSV